MARKAAKRAKTDAREEGKGPFGGYLREARVTGITCSSLLQVLAALIAVPPPKKVAEYVSANWRTLRWSDPCREGKDYFGRYSLYMLIYPYKVNISEFDHLFV